MPARLLHLAFIWQPCQSQAWNSVAADPLVAGHGVSFHAVFDAATAAAGLSMRDPVIQASDRNAPQSLPSGEQAVVSAVRHWCAASQLVYRHRRCARRQANNRRVPAQSLLVHPAALAAGHGDSCSGVLSS